MANGGPLPEVEVSFLHGVASFDPLPHAIILWTRVSVSNPAASVSVAWEVSTQRDFSQPVASGIAVALPERDHTVAVDVEGLAAGMRYYYRFGVNKLHSVTGITKTAAEGPLDELIFGVISCANWGFGYFNVLDLLAKVDNLDMVVHMGDYIYEYEKYFYPDAQHTARHGLRPKHRLQNLADYRERYACYRRDPGLQELHRRVPMIAVWDDHEIADSAYNVGSEDFEGSKKEWQAQKFQAIQAYMEWVPVRGMRHDRLDLAGCHRTLHFGDLATLMLVENRIAFRDEPVDLPNTAFYAETAKKDLEDWDEDAILPAKAELLKTFQDPDRKMIGEAQLQDVQEAVQESVAAGRPWQILISQTIMSQIRAPKLKETLNLQPKLLAKICRGALNMATSEKKAGKEGSEQARMYLGMGKFGVPMNPDAWDGYAAERERVLAALNVPGSNPVVMAGDSHNAWAHELIDKQGHRLGVEFDAPAITAIGFAEDIYSQFENKAGKLAKLFPLWLFTPWIEDSLKAANPDTLQYCNLNERGFVLFHVTKRRFHAEYHFVNTTKTQEYKNHCDAAFDTEVGAKGHLKRGIRYMTIDGVVPKRTRTKRSAILRTSRDMSSQMHAAWDRRT